MAERAHEVARWEDFVLRLIAIYKTLHGLCFVGLGAALFKLKYRDLPMLVQNWAVYLHFGPENTVVNWLITKADNITPHQMALAGYALFFYAALFIVEGVGLFLRQHWAEWLVVIVTGSLLPVEVWTIVHKVEYWKFVVIAGNLAIVGYLVHRLLLDSNNVTRRRKEKIERAEAKIARTGKKLVGLN